MMNGKVCDTFLLDKVLCLIQLPITSGLCEKAVSHLLGKELVLVSLGMMVSGLTTMIYKLISDNNSIKSNNQIYFICIFDIKHIIHDKKKFINTMFF